MISRLGTTPSEGAMPDSREGVAAHRWIRGNRDSLVLLLLALALIGSAISYGLNRGMDRLFSGPLDTRAQQIASAISDTAYGLDLKYAFHGKIRDALRSGGMSDVAQNLQPLGLKYPDHFLNTKLWNDLLPKAASLEGVTKPVSVSNKTLDFIHAEDLGLVDYYKLSFRLFGYNIQGFFYTYFLLLGISGAFLFFAFWSRPGILAGANFLLLGLVLSICQIDAIDSVADGRFLSTLAILPAFHLACLLWSPPRLTATAAVSTLLQSIFLAYVLMIRSSSMWSMLLLAALFAGTVVIAFRSVWASQPLKELIRKTVTWPVMVIAFGLAATTAYQKSTVHPAYSTLDELIPSHYFWSSIAAGLSYIDDIDAMIPGLSGARYDALGTYLGNAYLKQTMGFEPPSVSAYYASYHFPSLGRVRTYERVVQAAYLDFAWRHPATMLRLTFVNKPMEMLRLLTKSFVAVAKNWKYLALIFPVFVVAMLVVGPARRHKNDLILSLKLMGGLVIAVSLPAIVAYPSHMGDAFAVYAAAILLLLSAAATNLDSKTVRNILRQ